MMRRLRSIRLKLLAILALTTVAALVLAGAALLAIDVRSRIVAVQDDLVTQADIVALSSVAALSFDDRRAAEEGLRVLRVKDNVVAAALFDANGKLFASYVADPGLSLPTAPAAMSTKIDGPWVRVWRPVTAQKENLGSVYLQGRHDVALNALKSIAVLAAVMAASLAAALLISARLQSQITRPVLAMSEAARRVKAGDFHLRAEHVTEDEVGELADAFNAMLDELASRALSREAAIEALRRSDERYQLVVRGSSAGLWDWDIAAGTMFFSPRLRELLGYSEAELPDVPDSLTNIMHPDDRRRSTSAVREHIEQDKPYFAECRLLTKGGEWRWFQLTGMAEKDASGHAFRMAGSIIDVTERKAAEKVLADSNRAKDEFIATLAHELRNPLAPIRTGLDILRRDPSDSMVARRTRDTMQRQLAHMTRLVDDLLDISRVNSGKIRLERTRTQLRPALENAIEISRPALDARGHAFSVDLPNEDIELMADSTRLAQAVGNLLNNAAKYTPAGGKVALRARRDGEWALIEVADNGVGLPPEMLDAIFGLFTQVGRTLDSAQGGLGLGLYLVRSLVELHGGTVTAQSDGPARGSTFTIRFPCLPAAPRTDMPAATQEQLAARAGLKVLVVDDNVDAAETLCAVLEMSGHSTRSVHAGGEVFAAVAAFSPDVVLLDIGLPGMSGYEVARRLRDNPAFGRIFIVAVTGWGSQEDRRKSKEAGFDEHLTKPIGFEDLEPILGQVRGTERNP